MRLDVSWPMRWYRRSAPVRSTRTETPENFASKALATFSATGRSTDVYQTILPSFRAASISTGVIFSAAGACDRTVVENGMAALAMTAAEPATTCRLEGALMVMDVLPCRPCCFVTLPVPDTTPAADAATRPRQPARSGTPVRSLSARCRRTASRRNPGWLRERPDASPWPTIH